MTSGNEGIGPGRLFIHASNIHQGGGKSLLWAIIRSLPVSVSTVLVADDRLELPGEIPENIQVKKVLPSIFHRTMAERWLRTHVKKQDTVLCMGNLPPLFQSKGRVVVFLQNRYLIDDVNLNGFPLRSRLRIDIERRWLSVKMTNATEFVVQTPTMKKLLENKVNGVVPIGVLPFTQYSSTYIRGGFKPKERENEFDFIYVASGEVHKNHRILLQAWSLLATEKLFPSLCLTLNEVKFADLSREIENICQRDGLAITNVGELSHKDTMALYESAGALIYPSMLESFGLPLIEARQAGLAILAPELDYVRDLIDPEQSFDPKSATSIARAVKRHMKFDDEAVVVLSAGDFIGKILGAGLGTTGPPNNVNHNVH